MGKQIITGYVQPQSIDTESSVLGAMLLERDAVTDVIDVLKEDSFYDQRNKCIYTAIKDLFKNNEPIDLITVIAQLKKNSSLELAGGYLYVAGITSFVNSSANIEYHARIISELSMKRELINISTDTLQNTYDESNDVFELIGNLDSKINSIIEGNTKGSVRGFKELLNEGVQSLENMVDVDITGVPSGFTGLDSITGGWQNSDLIILAARPAMGKTALVVSFMVNAARMFNKSVAMFSLEMSKEQLIKRIISSECEIELQKIKKPKNIGEDEWHQIAFKSREIEDYPIFIDDTAGLSLVEFKAKASRLKRKHNIEMIIIDYLQLMSGDSKGNREQEIASISRGLKLVAKDLNIPIIALSQLSRAVESRGGDKRPMLSDLRESGSIEQDADMVGFIYRPEYYGITESEDGTNLIGKGQVIIAKNRQGSIDDVYLNFTGKYTKWTDDEVFENTYQVSNSENKFPDTENNFEF